MDGHGGRDRAGWLCRRLDLQRDRGRAGASNAYGDRGTRSEARPCHVRPTLDGGRRRASRSRRGRAPSGGCCSPSRSHPRGSATPRAQARDPDHSYTPARASWTADEDALLVLHAGLNPAVLGGLLDRSDRAIAGRLRRLGLRAGRWRSPHHPSPQTAGSRRASAPSSNASSATGGLVLSFRSRTVSDAASAPVDGRPVEPRWGRGSISNRAVTAEAWGGDGAPRAPARSA
jgi:hypothetical protein